MIIIDRQKSIYEQIYSQIKDQILMGKLKKGDKLLPTRLMAKEYGISRNTVVSAYEQLQVEGYVNSVIGSGFYVESIDIPYNIDSNSYTESIEKEEIAAPKYDFRYGNLEYNCYQNRKWRICINEAIDMLANENNVNYIAPEGLIDLRKELARFLMKFRGVKCNFEQIVITNGHQAAIDIIATLFNNKEWQFAIEEPGYDGCRVVFERRGFAPFPVTAENDGISINGLAALKKALVYVTPSHQFPNGSILPIGKRFELIDWARKSESYVIEDDYDSELRYNSKPIQSLQSLDESDRVIYIGTFSKSLSPDLRIAYIVFPNTILNQFREAYKVSNSGVPTLIQKALVNYMSSGEYENNIRTVRTFYKKKHDYIISALKRDGVTLRGTDAGLHMIMNIDSLVGREKIIEEMRRHNIGVYSTKRYWINQDNCPDNQVLIGFSAIPTDMLEKAMYEMNKAIDAILESGADNGQKCIDNPPQNRNLHPQNIRISGSDRAAHKGTQKASR